MKQVTSIDPNSISTKELHSILLTAIAPRPIAFASTINIKGEVNLSPFSFFNVFSSNPPTLIFSPARRVRDNTTKHTLQNVEAVKEVVINIVNYPIVEQMSLTSTEYEEGVNEFKKAGLTEGNSVKVKPPRVLESPVSFECKVDNIISLGNEGGAGNLVICKVVYIHINNEYLDEENNLDTKKLDLVARLGGSWYTRITEESLFEIPKPISTKGIGVDSLPKHIFKTDILSGNNIGRLGNFEKVPSEEEIEKFKSLPEIAEMLIGLDEDEKMELIHKKVKLNLKNGDVKMAIKLLFSL
ncbi:NADH-FMN oxidoreductase RutF, flavin reductase (DIM6/NTAB) family [Lutibacter oricola]|uniref:NADH-FMN oxidoreductase RutF, flavin reductase (DIM6/NTAB) family n=1 Tax=Lutibacter oricola TaxID=762486 RepID=A0A1H2SHX1_9FLAO|nr:flavin reductase family protein [Lutibacter oricola]SDW31127.1 NADH-FMN oxidoreductase RutF, flavin reductase (DIM6/NTAB) family [Lutibacter oricola]